MPAMRSSRKATASAMASIMASPALLAGCLGSLGRASQAHGLCPLTLLRSSFAGGHRGNGGVSRGCVDDLSATIIASCRALRSSLKPAINGFQVAGARLRLGNWHLASDRCGERTVQYAS